ncbi:MAG: hypothetical protein FE78DRAFT_33159 [Acidomyces sp. 'richmondensis']|nr:MAG: hypothetical protein FE78DRAFT_33159 [Acidomyces sp. 'richmondensis']
MHDPEEPTHTHVHPDSQTARQAGLVSYANVTFTDLLSWLPTRPTHSRYLNTFDLLRYKADSRASYDQYFTQIKKKIDEYKIEY